MCGIVGIVADSRDSPEELRASARRMSGAVAHRGPDDWGMITLHGDQIEHRSMTCPEGHTAARTREASREQTVVLAHRRLAIIDLSASGHQPMGTVDGRYWITYNGEIYNFRELRSELESVGATFRSTSDTEVLLELYARDGPSCLHRLRGMFAFAVWDEERRELFLARDRFGIKPLYYAQRSGMVCFASELGALLSSGLLSAERDRESEILFLERGSIPAPRTFYRDIRALSPGHWARFDGRELTVRPYWSLTEALSGANPLTRWTPEAAHRIREALVESVRAHLVSDVPVGVFLSGGLDSTAVVAAARQFSSGPLRTFTIVFPGTRWDESDLARRAVAHYGTDHIELEITEEDLQKSFDDLFSAMDQPTIDGVNTYFVAKAAHRAGVKVALSGLGGDETLGGYHSFVGVPRLRNCLGLIRHVPWLARPAASLVQHLPISWAPKAAQLLRRGSDEVGSVWRDCRALFTERELRAFSMVPVATRPASSAADEARDLFWSIAQLEIEQFMSPQLLRDSDVFTMCHGLELRTPFVDHLFLGAVREAGAWPRDGAPTYKIALFRQMGGFLPPGHLSQGKMGFTLPFEVWLRSALSKGTASPVGSDLRALLYRPYHRPFIDGLVRGKVHWSRVWALYVLERFKRREGQGWISPSSS